jgi:hypothetical protein
MVRILSLQTFAASASIVSVIAVSAAIIPKAEATASGCSGASCVWVKGSGTRVDEVIGGVRVSGGLSKFGHLEIWASYIDRTGRRQQPFHMNTPDQTYSSNCNYAVRPPKCSQTTWDLNESYKSQTYLPDGAKVCARFWQKIHNVYIVGDIACVNIER